MNKRYIAFGILVMGFCAMMSVRTCGTASSVELAMTELNRLIASHPLTENDKNMIKTIVDARLKGMMLKIAPNFSENGTIVYDHIITKSECLKGFETLRGIAYGVDVLQLMQ